MLKRLITVASLAAALSPWTVQAADRIVVLDVKNATCELCGPIVKKALSQVSGVKAIQWKEPQAGADAVATVTFDDATADVSKLIAASTNAGYPARLRN